MSTKIVRLSWVPISIGIIALLFGAASALIDNSKITIVSFLIGSFLISMSALSNRRSSKPFERILMLNPRDEREEKQIELGFAIVGKATLAIVFLLALSVLFFNVYAFISRQTPFVECITPSGSNQLFCTSSGNYYLSSISIIAIVVFGVIAVFSSAIASFRRL